MNQATAVGPAAALHARPAPQTRTTGHQRPASAARPGNTRPLAPWARACLAPMAPPTTTPTRAPPVLLVPLAPTLALEIPVFVHNAPLGLRTTTRSPERSVSAAHPAATHHRARSGRAATAASRVRVARLTRTATPARPACHVQQARLCLPAALDHAPISAAQPGPSR